MIEHNVDSWETENKISYSLKLEDRERLLSALRKVSFYSSELYPMWVRLGIYLKNCGFSFDDWCKFSPTNTIVRQRMLSYWDRWEHQEVGLGDLIKWCNSSVGETIVRYRENIDGTFSIETYLLDKYPDIYPDDEYLKLDNYVAESYMNDKFVYDDYLDNKESIRDSFVGSNGSFMQNLIYFPVSFLEKFPIFPGYQEVAPNKDGIYQKSYKVYVRDKQETYFTVKSDKILNDSFLLILSALFKLVYSRYDFPARNKLKDIYTANSVTDKDFICSFTIEDILNVLCVHKTNDLYYRVRRQLDTLSKVVIDGEKLFSVFKKNKNVFTISFNSRYNSDYCKKRYMIIKQANILAPRIKLSRSIFLLYYWFTYRRNFFKDRGLKNIDSMEYKLSMDYILKYLGVPFKPMVRQKNIFLRSFQELNKLNLLAFTGYTMSKDKTGKNAVEAKLKENLHRKIKQTYDDFYVFANFKYSNYVFMNVFSQDKKYDTDNINDTIEREAIDTFVITKNDTDMSLILKELLYTHKCNLVKIKNMMKKIWYWSKRLDLKSLIKKILNDLNVNLTTLITNLSVKGDKVFLEVLKLVDTHSKLPYKQNNSIPQNITSKLKPNIKTMKFHFLHRYT